MFYLNVSKCFARSGFAEPRAFSRLVFYVLPFEEITHVQDTILSVKALVGPFIRSILHEGLPAQLYVGEN